MATALIRFDGWTLNPQSGELERGGARVRLPEHPLQLLLALLERPGEVVSREQLIARLWPKGVVDFEMGLNSAVRKLRSALADTADTPRYIETLPRRGYRYIGRLEGGGGTDAAAAAPLAAAPLAGAVPWLARWRRPRDIALAVTGVLAACVVGYALLQLRGRPVGAGEGSPPARAATGTVPTGPMSVAVLPFASVGADPGLEAIATGLSEEVHDVLSRFEDLQVAPRSASFRFRGREAELRDVARQLHVVYVVEGSVQRSGAALRIQAQLVNAADGFRLWSQTYERGTGNTPALQTEIADAVADALRLRLQTAARVDLGGTRNPAALDAYLRGMRRSDATVMSAAEARTLIGCFDEAIRLDPGFALAYAARASALQAYGGAFTVSATRDAFVRARADAERAVALAPDLADAHAALGEVSMWGFLDFARADAEYARAAALAPNNPRVLRDYALFQGFMGRFDRSIQAARRSVALDPSSVLGHRDLGWALMIARHYAEAVVEFDEALKLNPGRGAEVWQFRGRTLYLLGDYAEAAASCEREPDRYEQQLCLPLAYEKLGQHERARAALTTAIAEQGEDAASNLAQIYAQRGEIAEALKWLEVAVRKQDAGLVYLKTDALDDPLRAQPRFQAILSALRFPAQ